MLQAIIRNKRVIKQMIYIQAFSISLYHVLVCSNGVNMAFYYMSSLSFVISLAVYVMDKLKYAVYNEKEDRIEIDSKIDSEIHLKLFISPMITMAYALVYMAITYLLSGNIVF